MQVAKKRRKHRAQKPWSEMDAADRLKEAREAKARLEDQLALNSRSLHYSVEVARNTTDAIRRWDATINDLLTEKGEQYGYGWDPKSGPTTERE